MAEFLIRNSLNPNKVVKLDVTFQQVASADDVDYKWLLIVATKEKDKYGDSIPPQYIKLTALDTMDEEMEKISSFVSKKIDWGVFGNDSFTPYISYNSVDSGVSGIDDRLMFSIADRLPSSGIDIDSIKVTINGFDVTEEINVEGTPYEYTVKWTPPAVVYDDE